MMVDSIFIKLIRKGAGVGPDYSLKISGKGILIYEGFENVDIKGERKEKIDQDKIIKLLSEFKKVDFFSLNDVYPVEDSDGRASCVIGVSITDRNGGTKTKNITHFHGDKNVPRRLLNLEEKIDRIADSKRWVGGPAQVLQTKNQPSSKKIESIVSKHEKSAEVRKVSSSLKKVIIGIALVLVLILVIFVVIQSGFIDNMFTNNSNKQIPQPASELNIKTSHLAGYAPLVVLFNISVESFKGDLSYAWDFDDSARSYDRAPAHVFINPGIYNVTCLVSDSNGLNTSDNVQIRVNSKGASQILVIYMSIDPSTKSGVTPFNLSFSCIINNGIPPYDYYWDFGDGSSSIKSNVTHVFNSKGIFPVTLYVTDSIGDSSSDMTFITCD